MEAVFFWPKDQLGQESKTSLKKKEGPLEFIINFRCLSIVFIIEPIIQSV